MYWFCVRLEGKTCCTGSLRSTALGNVLYITSDHFQLCREQDPLSGFPVVNIGEKIRWETLNEFIPEHTCMCAEHKYFDDLRIAQLSKIHICFHCLYYTH